MSVLSSLVPRTPDDFPFHMECGPTTAFRSGSGGSLLGARVALDAPEHADHSLARSRVFGPPFMSRLNLNCYVDERAVRCLLPLSFTLPLSAMSSSSPGRGAPPPGQRPEVSPEWFKVDALGTRAVDDQQETRTQRSMSVSVDSRFAGSAEDALPELSSILPGEWTDADLCQDQPDLQDQLDRFLYLKK